MHGNLGSCKRAHRERAGHDEGPPSATSADSPSMLGAAQRATWLVLLALACSSAGQTGPNAASPGTPAAPPQTLDESAYGATSDAASERAAAGLPAPNAADRAELPWLSPRHVGAAVRAHHGAFRACQTLADMSSQHRDGAVTVGWLVKTDGSVDDVTVGPSSFESARVNHCVLSVAKRVTFPPSSVQAHVSWTVKFRGTSDASLAEAGPPATRRR